MSTWFYAYLGDVMTASSTLENIRAAFLPASESAGKPAVRAVFTRNDSAGRLHCELYVYFSPAAGEIARSFDAKPCERPLRPGLELLVGDENSWSVLFPENKAINSKDDKST